MYCTMSAPHRPSVHVLSGGKGGYRYYIDHLNARPAYMDTFMDKLINWDKVEARYTAALA